MKLSPALVVALLLTAVSAALAGSAWTSLPPGAGIPVNVLGADGHMHAQIIRSVIWILPAVAAVVTAGFALAGRRRGAEAAALPMDMTLIGVVGVLLVAEIAMLGRATDPAFNVMRPVAVAVGVLLIAIGNYLGKARRNAVFGLRTPWTLADATVWDRTHRFTGLAMVLGGLLLIALAVLLNDADAIGVSIGACAAGPPLAGVLRSATLHRRLQRG